MKRCKGALGGVVLAGGLASRMGFDKATIRQQSPWARYNLLEHNVRLLQTACDTVWVSCRADGLRDGFTCVPDIYPERGPAGAIHASLLHAQSLNLDGILVLACDMPAVTEQSLHNLCEARVAPAEAFSALQVQAHEAPTLMTAYWQPERDFVQSLLAIYEVGSLPYFQQAVEEQKVKLRWIVPREAQRRILYSSPEEQDIFFNLNTPKDVESWQKGLR